MTGTKPLQVQITGLIDASGMCKIYASTESCRPFATPLEIEDEANDHYAYIIQSARSARTLTRIMPQTFIG